MAVAYATAATCSFAETLEEFGGVFDEVAFAITDWSPEQRFIGPFKKAIAAAE